MSEPLATAAAELLTSARQQYPEGVWYALFSGGHDSLTATAVTMEWAELVGQPAQVVHINTGIGIPETRKFVRTTCRERGWELLEYEALPRAEHLRAPGTYEELVLRFGFPGPAGHTLAYRALKHRQLERLWREQKLLHPKGSRPVFATGIRRQESVRRMGYHTESIRRWKGSSWVWVNPLLDWSKAECHELMEARGLPRNRVVDLLHMSGECLCGAFAARGERDEIRLWFPEVDAYLAELEQRVYEAGHHACVWGARPPDVHQDQQHLFSPLCTSCEVRGGRG